MLKNIIVFTLTLLMFSSFPSHAEPNKTIYILATGGTIAGKQASKSEPGYKAGAFKVQDLIDAVPLLNDVANLKGEQIANIGSQDMNDKVWLKLAKRINVLLKDKHVDAIVITHGTDTLEETAYFLNLVVKSEKPVILTASMRPATSISPDGPMNLYQAVVVATKPEATDRGVMVVMNNEIHYAAEITKTHTVNPDTMRSPNRGLAGKCDAKICTFFSPTIKIHTSDSKFSVPDDLESLPRVDIIYAHANASQDLINAAANMGAKGIVIAGVGDGNMTNDMLDGVTKLAKQGIVIVRSTHVGAGIVKRNVEINDDALGFVAARELNPQKARVLLQLALLETDNVKKIQDYYLNY